jgi:hypothetical protein
VAERVAVEPRGGIISVGEEFSDAQATTAEIRATGDDAAERGHLIVHTENASQRGWR